MSEPVTTEQAPVAPEAAQETPTAPPWGDDFDPARAWDKIQKANSEAKGLRDRVNELSQRAISDEQRQQLDEYQRLVEASKSDNERKEEALASAQRLAEASQSEALRYKVALKHGLTEDDFDLLGTGSEAQIESRAQRLAEKNKAVADAMAALEAPVPGAPTPTPRRPSEALKPGATPAVPNEPAEEDYPSTWLSPTQRARLEQARERTP